MEAGKRTINDIFNGNRTLEIPFFQRSYVWEEKQWERFIVDMENICISNKTYFLGPLILKQQLTNTENEVGDKRTIIDGQQRLTTLNIFLKVLCLKNNENSIFDKRFRIDRSGEIAVRHNHNDIESFEKILNLTEEKDIDGDNQIILAYRYFKNNIDPNNVQIQKLLDRILFVGIDLYENEDEQQIFDTINSIGVELTSAELLKNFFFNRTEIDIYNIYWKSIFEKDQDSKNYWDREITTGRMKRGVIDLFFYSYLQIKIHDGTFSVNANDKIEFSRVENLFESYKKFIKVYLDNEKHRILEEIREYALIFKKNFIIDVIENELTDQYGIERITAIIFGLETSTLIPYVLYVLKNVQDPKTINELFEFIECYIMRRIAVHAITKNYNHFFTDRMISNKILSKKSFKELLENQEDKINFLPTDEELKVSFHLELLNNKQSAGILYFIESKIRNRHKQSTQLLGFNKYSLEHLMPKKWENHWESSLNEEEIKKRNRVLLTLGNLTIITQSLNSTIRDSNWSLKKYGKGDKKGLLQYSSGLETISKYLELKEWNENTIEERANDLYEYAIDIWKI
jgi:uncharacterized protein with ParB-like and HNH nuclease domain